MARRDATYRTHVNEPSAPCWNDGKDCPDRDGINCCHSYCERFLEWEKNHNELRERLRKDRFKNRLVANYNIERSIKAKEEFNK